MVVVIFSSRVTQSTEEEEEWRKEGGRRKHNQERTKTPLSPFSAPHTATHSVSQWLQGRKRGKEGEGGGVVIKVVLLLPFLDRGRKENRVEKLLSNGRSAEEKKFTLLPPPSFFRLRRGFGWRRWVGCGRKQEEA